MWSVLISGDSYRTPNLGPPVEIYNKNNNRLPLTMQLGQFFGRFKIFMAAYIPGHLCPEGTYTIL